MDGLSANMTTPRATDIRIPGDKDVWVLIGAELLTFGMFFVAFIGYRALEVAHFNASQTALHRNLGLLNTLFLVTSSWCVVQAVRAAREDRPASVARSLGIAILLGISFMVVKALEYTELVSSGVGMTTDNFFMFYYCLTIIHLLHVVGGTVILTVMWANARTGRYHSGNTKGLETGASYWHMVDLLWIFLFPLLYLVR